MKEQLHIEAALIPGGGGVFDVKTDGDLIYSKHETDRFPSDEEIIDSLRRRVAG